MSGSRFTVQFFKSPDRLHWRHDMVRLGEDEHGVWVGPAAYIDTSPVAGCAE